MHKSLLIINLKNENGRKQLTKSILRRQCICAREAFLNLFSSFYCGFPKENGVPKKAFHFYHEFSEENGGPYTHEYSAMDSKYKQERATELHSVDTIVKSK